MSIVLAARDVRATLRALHGRNFLVFAGLSGTGKTQLARRLAAALGSGDTIATLTEQLDAAVGGRSSGLFGPVQGHPGFVTVAEPDADDASGHTPARKRTAFLPVRTDWSDARRIWGHYNVLTGAFHPTDALVVALNAFRDFLERGADARRFFIVLDEMNLARVEFYLSDLISLMELPCRLDEHGVRLGETVRLHPMDELVVSRGRRVVEDEDAKGPDQQRVPLFDLGGRRWIYEPLVDGSARAYPPARAPRESDEDVFGPAFPIPPRIAVSPNLTVLGTINVDETTHGFSPRVLDRAFVVEFGDVDYAAALGRHPRFEALSPLLERIDGALAPSGRRFGYRVAREMLDYVDAAGGFDAEVGDALVLGKVLPRLHGTQELAGVVGGLLDACDALGLSRSSARLRRMQADLEATGFTSYL